MYTHNERDRVAIFIDGENIHYSAKHMNMRLDYLKLCRELAGPAAAGARLLLHRGQQPVRRQDRFRELPEAQRLHRGHEGGPLLQRPGSRPQRAREPGHGDGHQRDRAVRPPGHGDPLHRRRRLPGAGRGRGPPRQARRGLRPARDDQHRPDRRLRRLHGPGQIRNEVALDAPPPREIRNDLHRSTTSSTPSRSRTPASISSPHRPAWARPGPGDRAVAVSGTALRGLGRGPADPCRFPPSRPPGSGG